MKSNFFFYNLALIVVWATTASSFGQDASVTTLPPATIGAPYKAQLQMTVSGVTPFTYSLGSDSHPDWLALSSTGEFSGTPADKAAKTYNFQVMVTDATGHQTSASVKLAVSNGEPVVAITPVEQNAGPVCKPITIQQGLAPGSTTLKGNATPSQGSYDISLSVDGIFGATNPSQARHDLTLDQSLRKALKDGNPLPALTRAIFRSRLATKDTSSSRVGTDGTFTLQLAQPLDGGETVIVTQHGCQDGQPPVSGLGSALVQDATETPSGASVPATTNSTDKPAQTNSADASASHSSTPPAQGAPATTPGNAKGKKGAGTASRSQPPASGSSTSGSGNNVASSSSVPGNLDWGRVKALFMVGAIFSNQDQSFSQSNLFASLLLDKAWRLPGEYGYAETANGYENFPGTGGRRPGINSFFEARLTAIPVSSNTQTDSKAGQSGSSSQSSSTTQTVSSFLSNQKDARFDFGLYSPFLITHWTHDQGPQSLYLAPLVKGGFDTLTSSTSVTVPGSSSSGSSSSGTIQVPRVYNWFGAGLRVGHYHLHNDANEAPDQISHLDAVFGKFSNFETLVSNCPTALTQCRTRLWRMGFEGLLQIPTPDSFPLYVGLSANIGQKAFGASHVIAGGDAGDDLRFFFGTRLDLGVLVTKLKGISGSSSNSTNVGSSDE